MGFSLTRGPVFPGRLWSPGVSHESEALSAPFPRSSSFSSVLICLVAALGCGTSADQDARLKPTYDASGKLQLLEYDADGDGKVDTWSYMDGTRVVRIELDPDQDGRIDRWEYYEADEKIEKIGTSRANDGKADAWAFYAADGSMTRLELSTKRDDKVDRIEYYDNGAMIRAEQDTSGDGTIDKWEVYDGSRLASVAFDTTGRGSPDRRLVYGADGSARLEVAPNSDGRFVPAAAPARPGAP